MTHSNEDEKLTAAVNKLQRGIKKRPNQQRKPSAWQAEREEEGWKAAIMPLPFLDRMTCRAGRPNQHQAARIRTGLDRLTLGQN